MKRPDESVPTDGGVETPPMGPRRPGGEAALFAVATVLFIATEIAVLRAGVLFSRPLWLDEIHTLLLATGQPFSESMRSLAAGADFNPPTVFVLYRMIGELAGGLSAPLMRGVALLCVIGGLTAAYVLLREQFSRPAAAAGVLAVWSQSVVVAAAFEGRFYGPLLLANGWFLVALRRVMGEERPSGWTRGWLALGSIAVCSIHYFGVLSWAAGVGTVLVLSGATGPVIRRVAPAVAGPVATLACIPLYLGQREALSVATWIPEVSLGGAALLLMILLLPAPTVAAVLAWGVAALGRRRGADSVATRNVPRLALGPSLLLGQAAVPLVLAVGSLVAQPVTPARYWVVGAFASAPLVAFATSRSGRVLGGVVAATTLMWSVTTVRVERMAAETHARRVAEDKAVVAGVDSTTLVVARRRHALYPLLQARGDLRSRAALFDASAMRPSDAFLAVERDVTRVHQRWFGFPLIMTPADLDSASFFVLVEHDSSRGPTSVEFPRHDIRRVGPRAYTLRRR